MNSIHRNKLVMIASDSWKDIRIGVLSIPLDMIRFFFISLQIIVITKEYWGYGALTGLYRFIDNKIIFSLW